MNLLQLSGVRKSFTDPPLTALDKVKMTIAKGTVTALVGPSGCGKSTLLRIIAGLSAPSQGSLAWSVDSPLVALMPQRDGLFSWNTIEDNVALPLRIRGVPRQEARKRARALLAQFDLQQFSGAYPAQLSGGMRSRVAFLRTMLAKPTLIALDEPFGALDQITRSHMQRWLWQAARSRDLTLLLVTHDIAEAVTLADRVLMMSQRPGSIITEIPIEIPEREQFLSANSPATAGSFSHGTGLRSTPSFVKAYQEIENALWGIENREEKWI